MFCKIKCSSAIRVFHYIATLSLAWLTDLLLFDKLIHLNGKTTSAVSIHTYFTNLNLHLMLRLNI